MPTQAARRRVRTWQVVVLWLVCMAPLLGWGLPTSRYGAYLFGGDPPWDAARYGADEAAQLRRERRAGADTDLDPLAGAERIIDLTADDAARAAILLRYRLYSRQPDEMITFQALQRMNPRALDFDPCLYQYGGAYIYLIGAVLAAASWLGLLTLTSDVGVYLEQPELFARFYVVARAVTLLFGALTLAAAVRLARRGAGRAAGWVALVLAAAAPVFISDVVEAKPHLLSAGLLLWATLSALDYAADGRRRDALRMGLLTGGAVGLVPTGLAGVLLWPALLLARGGQRRRAGCDLLLGGLLLAAVYAATNPYVVYNLLFGRAALASNLANSLAMYSVARLPAGLLRVGQLLLESCGAGVLSIGCVALLWLGRHWPRRLIIAAAPGLALLALCSAIGAGKPAEFARFLLLPALLLAIAAAVAIAAVAARRPALGLLLLVAALSLMRTPAYLRSLAIDTRFDHESRHQAAAYLRDHAAPGDAIGLIQVPAPYATPPLDFAHRRVLLLPPQALPDDECRDLPTWLVLTADDQAAHAQAWWQQHYQLIASFAADPLWLSRISWANKPVLVYRRATGG